uniref:Probable oligoribonuclease n=1 Tax=Panagrolaimus superbus TaxID=310955 RepID=A0A914Y024_9BILA
MISRFFQRIFPRLPKSGIIMSSSQEDPSSIENADVPSTTEPPIKKEKRSGPLPLSSKIIWIDCEMTGLDPEINRLCEIAAVITEGDLTHVATFDPLIINQSEEAMKNMSKWCKTTFKKNGLINKIKESEITTSAAEEMLLKFLQEHTEPFTCALGGNSVYMDRIFIQREMPKVAAHLHYRTVDVSTIKELIRRWYPEVYEKLPPKQLCHRAIDDILESIEELKYYQQHVFIPLPNSIPATKKEEGGAAVEEKDEAVV